MLTKQCHGAVAESGRRCPFASSLRTDACLTGEYLEGLTHASPELINIVNPHWVVGFF